MKRTFAEAMAHRRSYYSIGSDSPVLDEEIVHIIREAVKNVPSAFNSQSTRIVLLLGDEHKKLWNIVKETLKARISAEAFAKTEAKIDGCFASGHGTVLYFEDTSVVKKLQETFPSYKDNFPTWSQHTSAMHQFAIWTMLEDMGGNSGRLRKEVKKRGHPGFFIRLCPRQENDAAELMNE